MAAIQQIIKKSYRKRQKKFVKNDQRIEKMSTFAALLINKDCFTDLKSKENEEISFNVRSYRSYLFRIMW